MTAAEKFDARVLGVIRRNPGVRAVEIAARLDADIWDVRASLYRAKRDAAVRTRGNTRATTYTVRGAA